MITEFLSIAIGRNISYHDYDELTDVLYGKCRYEEKDDKIFLVIDDIPIAICDDEGDEKSFTKEGIDYLKPIIFKYLNDNLEEYARRIDTI